MGEIVVVDVVDRPRGGTAAALRRLRAAHRAAGPPVAAVGMRTIRFTTRTVPRFTPRRLAVLTSWADEDAAEAGWPALLGELAEGGREHWHVRGQAVRADFTEPREGWVPETGGGDLRDDEPALVVISGELRPRYLGRFTRDQRPVVGQLDGTPGYLAGVGAQSSATDTTSISAWRSYADAKRYAYAAGEHREAMRRDLAEQRHRTSWFLRVRPLSERGTLDGAEVFGALLAPSSGSVPEQPAAPTQEQRRRQPRA